MKLQGGRDSQRTEGKTRATTCPHVLYTGKAEGPKGPGAVRGPGEDHMHL